MAYKIPSKKSKEKKISYSVDNPKREEVREAIKNKFNFWEKRTGDIPTTNYIAVREIAQEGLFKGKKTHYASSDQVIVERNGKIIYDSNRSAEFYNPKSKKSAINYVMRNIDLNKVSLRK